MLAVVLEQGDQLAVGHIAAGVDRADLGEDGFHVGLGLEQARGLERGGLHVLARGARLSIDRHVDVAGIAGGLEAGGDKAGHDARENQESGAQAAGHPAVRQRPVQAALIVAGQIRRRGRVLARHQEIGRHQGRQETGDGQGEQHRYRHGDAELAEELADHAVQGRHRQEHHHDGEGRGHHRQADGRCALDGRLIGPRPTLDAFLDIFDLDDGVIDQDADHQGQGQQGHHIEAEIEHRHHGEGRDQRQGHGDGRDHGRAPFAQEQQHHQGRQGHALQQHVHRRFVTEAGLFDRRQNLGELDVLVVDLQLLDGLEHGLLDRDVRIALGLGHLEGGHRLAVQQGEAALLG